MEHRDGEDGDGPADSAELAINVVKHSATHLMQIVT